MSNHTEEIINRLSKEIKEKISGGTLFGEKIDSENLSSMIVAAYNLAKMEEYATK